MRAWSAGPLDCRQDNRDNKQENCDEARTSMSLIPTVARRVAPAGALPSAVIFDPVYNSDIPSRYPVSKTVFALFITAHWLPCRTGNQTGPGASRSAMCVRYLSGIL